MNLHFSKVAKILNRKPFYTAEKDNFEIDFNSYLRRTDVNEGMESLHIAVISKQIGMLETNETQ